MPIHFQDLSGQRFGRLVVLERAPNDGRRTMFRCICDCGNEVIVRAENLKSGNTRSCGCYQKDHPTNYRHGYSKTRLASIFGSMCNRCYNPASQEYYLYGARGITICDEWLNDRTKFFHWAETHGYIENAKQKECSIDRIDVNKGYSPENCRWVDSYVQANNTRRNKYYLYNGEKLTLAQIARLEGVDYHKLWNKVNRSAKSLMESIEELKVA